MTPDEGAERIWNLVCEGWETVPAIRLVSEIAFAIRAAENEALERAAVRVSLRHGGRGAAAAIRGLKHPEGK